MPLQELVDEGKIIVQQVDPAQLQPGELAHLIRQAVEVDKTRVLTIDSLNGYLNAVPEERFLLLHLHEILSYLGQNGVATILVFAQHGLIGTSMASPIDVSYLADCVILTRYFETRGEIRKALSVIKKRSGVHETSIRDFILRADKGIEIGAPLEQYHGVLSGIPQFDKVVEELRGR